MFELLFLTLVLLQPIASLLIMPNGIDPFNYTIISPTSNKVYCDMDTQRSDRPSRAIGLCTTILLRFRESLPAGPLRWTTNAEHASPEIGSLPFERKVVTPTGALCILLFDPVDDDVDDTFEATEAVTTGEQIISQCLTRDLDGASRFGPTQKVFLGISAVGQ